MSTNGKLEAQITVPAGGWAIALTDQDAGPTTITVPAGTYYHSNAGSEARSFPDTIATLANGAMGQDWTCAVAAGESGTGKYTIACAGTTCTVTFTAADAGALMGFTGNLSGSTSYTSAGQAKALWLPGYPFQALNGALGWLGWWEVDQHNAENSRGDTFSIVGQKKQINSVKWAATSRAKCWISDEVTANESFEQFLLDGIFSGASWGTAAGPVRFYGSADDTSTWAEYAVLGMEDWRPDQIVDHWTGYWVIELPRLVLRSSCAPWTGTFDRMPSDSAEAALWLGIDGTLTTDLGDISHFWRTTVVATPDTGTGTAYNTTGFNAPTVALNADYESGATGKEVLVVGTDTHAIATAVGSNAIPTSPMSSTHRSYMLCAAFTPAAANDDDAALTERSVVSNRNTLPDYNGWNLFFQNASGAAPRRLRSRIDFATGAHTVTSTLAFTYDLPVFACVVVDFAESLMKIIVAQGATVQYDEISITASGSFLSSQRLSIGYPIGLGTPWAPCRGYIGLVNTFEWAVATASNVTEANVARYLKYTDGVLT